MALSLSVPLPHGFEERDDRRHGDVERVGLAGHRDADEHIRPLYCCILWLVPSATPKDKQPQARIGTPAAFAAAAKALSVVAKVAPQRMASSR